MSARKFTRPFVSLRVALVCFPLFLAAAAHEAWSELPSEVVIPVPRAEEASRLRNLLENADFNKDVDAPAEGWGKYELGCSLVKKQGRRGGRCLVCENSGRTQQRGAVAHLTLNQRSAIPLYVEGWSKAENVSGGSNADYSIYVDCIYDDGTPLWGTNAPFSTGTHGWQKVSFFVTPARPIKSLSLYLLFRSHSGKAWFDDIRLTQLTSSGAPSFDGVPALRPGGAPLRTPPEAAISSGDGFVLGLDKSGSASILSANGRPVRFTGAPSGFFARDAAARSAFHSFRGTTSPGKAGRGVLSMRSASLGLELDVTVEGTESALEVAGTLSDPMRRDRSVSLYFGLPVGGKKWVWWDDATSRRNAAEEGEFRNVVPVGAGENGTMSRYPLCALSDANSGIGLSIAVPMDCPRLYRLAYDADRGILYIVYDFGLCHDVEAFPGKASFRFIIYSFEPGWGFRGALKKYCDLYPQFFAKRVKDEGLWMAFLKISSIENLEDFGFVFKEGNNETKFDDEHGILTFRYTEPQTYWQKMPKEVDRTYQGCVDFLKRSAAEGNRSALATVSSGIFDERGNYRLTVENAPWCDGCVFALNPSPRLKGELTKGKLNYDPSEADRQYVESSEQGLDGEYLDSLEGWSTLCNFRREHFASAGIPLTFDTLTKKPCILNAFSIYEFASYISEDVHKRGELMMANSVPLRFGFLCHLFDTCGIEINWKRRGTFQPEEEWIMNYRRAMMSQKPYLFLMNTDFNSWTYDDTERYIRRCMFYAFYPSFFSADASTSHYFSQPRLYNRDRPLFKKYLPIIRELGKAGWQPIPHAATFDPDVRIERYGESLDRGLYFTLLNTSSKKKEATVEVDLAAVGLAGRQFSAAIVSSTAVIQLDWRGRVVLMTLTLSPGDTEVVRLRER